VPLLPSAPPVLLLLLLLLLLLRLLVAAAAYCSSRIDLTSKALVADNCEDRRGRIGRAHSRRHRARR
jgi:hypothetical protein